MCYKLGKIQRMGKLNQKTYRQSKTAQYQQKPNNRTHLLFLINGYEAQKVRLLDFWLSKGSIYFSEENSLRTVLKNLKTMRNTSELADTFPSFPFPPLYSHPNPKTELCISSHVAAQLTSTWSHKNEQTQGYGDDLF